VIEHGVEGGFERGGLPADLAEEQSALDAGQRRGGQAIGVDMLW
jgi:hypothetical protein